MLFCRITVCWWLLRQKMQIRCKACGLVYILSTLQLCTFLLLSSPYYNCLNDLVFSLLEGMSYSILYSSQLFHHMMMVRLSSCSPFYNCLVPLVYPDRIYIYCRIITTAAPPHGAVLGVQCSYSSYYQNYYLQHTLQLHWMLVH